MTKGLKLRRLFKRKGLIYLVGAHDGLGAKLIEQNEFDGVWASSLEISTSYAVPDANILTMSQHLERACEMNDVVSIPVIADCETGYGGPNNVIHMVRKYEAAGIAAVCMEDKKFPKLNSLFPGRQELAPIAEFVGKIMAAKDAQRTKEFMVFARVEALIAGRGQKEALRRARAYVKAGADAILIHSKTTSPEPIIDFAKSWQGSAPLIIIPTTYPTIRREEIKELGIKMIIYANQVLRAAVKAMDLVLAEIYRDKSTLAVEDKIAPVKKLFELQGMHQIEENKKVYPN